MVSLVGGGRPGAGLGRGARRRPASDKEEPLRRDAPPAAVELPPALIREFLAWLDTLRAATGVEVDAATEDECDWNYLALTVRKLDTAVMKTYAVQQNKKLVAGYRGSANDCFMVEGEAPYTMDKLKFAADLERSHGDMSLLLPLTEAETAAFEKVLVKKYGLSAEEAAVAHRGTADEYNANAKRGSGKRCVTKRALDLTPLRTGEATTAKRAVERGRDDDADADDADADDADADDADDADADDADERAAKRAARDGESSREARARAKARAKKARARARARAKARAKAKASDDEMDSDVADEMEARENTRPFDYRDGRLASWYQEVPWVVKTLSDVCQLDVAAKGMWPVERVERRLEAQIARAKAMEAAGNPEGAALFQFRALQTKDILDGIAGAA